jgi:flagellar biosynthesis protein FlhA
MKERGLPPVILCSPKARFPVKEATRKQLPELAVLSYLEIPSDIIVEPVGEIISDKTGEFRIRSRE